LALILSLSAFCHAEEIKLAPEDDSEGNYLQIDNHEPSQTSRVKLDFYQHFDEAVTDWAMITTACYESDGTETEGEHEAFGFQWFCMAPECTHPTHFAGYLFGSTIHQSSDGSWTFKGTANGGEAVPGGLSAHFYRGGN
jgi:hypothetical protein